MYEQYDDGIVIGWYWMSYDKSGKPVKRFKPRDPAAVEKDRTRKVWHSVPEHILELAQKRGMETRVHGAFPFQVREVLATEPDINAMYDWFCP